MFAQTTAASEPKLDTGDTAWMLTSAALVFFMTIPGLFLFYGGLVRSNVLPFTYHRKEICRNCQAPDERQLKILSISGAATFQSFVGTAAYMGLVKIISAFGSAAIAGNTIGIRIFLFGLLPSWGVSNAAVTLVDFAHRHKITQTLLTRSSSRHFKFLPGRGLVSQVLRLAHDIQITIVAERQSPVRA